MSVDTPLLLWSAPLWALLAWWLARRAVSRRHAAAAAWSASLGATARQSGRRTPWTLGGAALLAAIGLAGPRWGVATQVAESRARNIVFVVDVSRSMLAQDALPDRLTRATSTARRLVQDLPGDRLGLVAFAARPYLLAPLTLDQSALALQLDALDPEVASEGGSAIGASLVQAAAVLAATDQGGDKAIVLLTDGEAFDGEDALVEAGQRLRKDGIALAIVPFGTPEGARIPDGREGWHKDGSGQEVVTMRRDDLIEALATAAEATVIPADTPDPAGEVRRALERLERAAARDRLAADRVPRAWLFALAAAAVLLGHAWTRRTAALAGLLLAAASPLAAQRPETGIRLLQRGDTAAAREAFLADAKRRSTDTAWYNAGTAALVGGDIPTAVDALARASVSLDPDLRRRALYNLGTTFIRAARRDSTRADSLLGLAEQHLRGALQLAPSDPAAKFNYELARRLRRPPPPPSGGGGGGSGEQQQDPKRPPPRGGQNGMSEAEAEQVLNAMERAERETRQNLARRQRRGQPPAGPDW
ncbi:MAG TPA: VWA domain-containing protein [Gemmatimonadales bacterium]|nr:VWA domain-containing protein [Gemmatimonadales bacterium]